MDFNRRNFLKNTLASATSLTAATIIPGRLFAGELCYTNRPEVIIVKPPKRLLAKESIRFSVIGLNHSHIYGMVNSLIKGGGTLVSVFAKEPELLSAFKKHYSNVKIAQNENEILEDNSIQLIASASIPVDRAPLGIKVMESGKDYMVDKPGIITLEQFEEVKKVQKKTNRTYFIVYSERLGNRASTQATSLIQAGAIGKVIQTIGLGPHRMRPVSRPDWFFDTDKAGGILCDIGSHQCDQFLHYTGSKQGEVNFAQTGNFNFPDFPDFMDFGDMSVRSAHATGYIRVDWFTPDGLATWGDGRTFILGTDGYIEMRKYIDIAGRQGENHLFMVNQKEAKYFDCSQVEASFGHQLVYDVVHRTETAMTQEHCFLATELALKAQKGAVRLSG